MEVNCRCLTVETVGDDRGGETTKAVAPATQPPRWVQMSRFNHGRYRPWMRAQGALSSPVVAGRLAPTDRDGTLGAGCRQPLGPAAAGRAENRPPTSQPVHRTTRADTARSRCGKMPQGKPLFKGFPRRDCVEAVTIVDFLWKTAEIEEETDAGRGFRFRG